MSLREELLLLFCSSAVWVQDLNMGALFKLVGATFSLSPKQYLKGCCHGIEGLQGLMPCRCEHLKPFQDQWNCPWSIYRGRIYRGRSGWSTGRTPQEITARRGDEERVHGKVSNIASMKFLIFYPWLYEAANPFTAVLMFDLPQRGGVEGMGHPGPQSCTWEHTIHASRGNNHFCLLHRINFHPWHSLILITLQLDSQVIFLVNKKNSWISSGIMMSKYIGFGSPWAYLRRSSNEDAVLF